MSNVEQMIHQARGRLMQSVATLQTPGLPPELSDSARPLAQVAGMLEQLQATNANAAPTYPLVLSTLQRALHDLQWSRYDHPLRDAAIDHVAGALGLVFSVSREPLSSPTPGSSAAPTVPVSAVSPAIATAAVSKEAPTKATASTNGAASAQPAKPAVAAQKPEAQKASVQPQVPKTAPKGAPPVVVSVAPPTVRQGENPSPASDRRRDPNLPLVAAAVKAAGKEPASTAVPRSLPEAGKPMRAPTSRPPNTEGAGQLRLDAQLGANSASNFYRGFDGDDVVDHGGVFVATYNLPSLGQRIALRVSLPDGHEFMTHGVVKWRRLPAADGSHPHDIPPGFGLSMEDVSDSARSVIARYVHNREPLFHDDA